MYLSFSLCMGTAIGKQMVKDTLALLSLLFGSLKRGWITARLGTVNE